LGALRCPNGISGHPAMRDTPPPPAATVLVVSDHVVGGRERWDDLGRAVRALALQLTAEPFDILVCDSERFRADMPPDFAELHPRLHVHFVPDYGSYAVKNAGVTFARTAFVALLDADCVPGTNRWLEHLLVGIRSDPKIGAISGPTAYPGRSFLRRASGLLGRSYTNPGAHGPTQFIAINNCVFRRDAYLESPLPEGMGTFLSRIQSEAMAASGFTLLFDPTASVFHDYEGLRMEADFRRNCGYGTIRTRLEDPSLPYAQLVRRGPVAIPFVLGGKLIGSWRDCIRCGRQYGVKGLGLPAAMFLSIPLHLAEVPGMLHAYRRTRLRDSAFR